MWREGLYANVTHLGWMTAVRKTHGLAKNDGALELEGGGIGPGQHCSLWCIFLLKQNS
jgi:hypothetical protein